MRSDYLYNTEAVYVETVPVKEVFQGQTVWEGEVEVFDLPDSPDADRIYAWAHDTDNVDNRDAHSLSCMLRLFFRQS